MLIHLRNLVRIDSQLTDGVRDWAKWSRLIAVATLLSPLSSMAQSSPATSGTSLNSPAYGQAPSGQGMIQQVQNTPQSARSIHHLIESMPQASEELEIIQQRSQLITTRANIVRMSISDQAILDVVQYTPTQFSLVGLALGSSTLTIWFENQAEPLIYTVKTIRDPNIDYQRRLDYGKLEKRLAALFPNSKVYLIPTSRKILVRGQARDSNEAAHILAIVRGEIINQEGSLFGPQAVGMQLGGGAGGIVGGYANGYGGGVAGIGFGGLNAFDLAASFIINELQVPGEFQVLMRIRVAELSRTSADNAGVNLNVLFNDARQGINTAIGAASGAGTISGTFENGQIGVFLDWLCSNGTARILAEPQATVLSGRNVRFLAGGEFAVPTTVGIGGAQGTTTSFRGFGTSLMATPTIMDRDNIRIALVAEYSNITQQNSVGGIPGMSTRRIETVVEMREGQTMALGGLLSTRTTTAIQRIPLLGDIPTVGALLFSAKQMTNEENELLILLTPELVRPMDAHEVPPVPGFDVPRPSHEEFWKYNMTEGPYNPAYYQSAPYGSGTTGTNVDYQHFNPGPAGSMNSPIPTNPGPTPINQYNAVTPTRQIIPTPQAGIQRNGGQRTARNSASQVIPSGGPEVRQTNYSSGQSSDRRNQRQNSYGQ